MTCIYEPSNVIPEQIGRSNQEKSEVTRVAQWIQVRYERARRLKGDWCIYEPSEVTLEQMKRIISFENTYRAQKKSQEEEEEDRFRSVCTNCVYSG